MDQYTIGQLAEAAGVPTSTVRYYERRKLLSAGRRSRGNYRLFSSESLDRLRFICAAHDAGFTLSDVAVLLDFRDGSGCPCGEIQNLIASRLGHVTEQLAHLREVDGLLREWLRVCRLAEKSGRCGVLEGLGRSAAKRRKKKVRIASGRC